MPVQFERRGAANNVLGLGSTLHIGQLHTRRFCCWITESPTVLTKSPLPGFLLLSAELAPVRPVAPAPAARTESVQNVTSVHRARRQTRNAVNGVSPRISRSPLPVVCCTATSARRNSSLGGTPRTRTAVPCAVRPEPAGEVKVLIPRSLISLKISQTVPSSYCDDCNKNSCQFCKAKKQPLNPNGKCFPKKTTTKKAVPTGPVMVSQGPLWATMPQSWCYEVLWVKTDADNNLFCESNGGGGCNWRPASARPNPPGPNVGWTRIDPALYKTTDWAILSYYATHNDDCRPYCPMWPKDGEFLGHRG